MIRSVIVAAAIAAIAAAALLWASRASNALPPGTSADLLVVDKSAHRLSVYSHNTLVRSYSVSLGRQPAGAKLHEGDHRTPEGRYVIDQHNPHSAYHLALHISYPAATDRARAAVAGYPPGGNVMIHGMRNGLGWLGRTHLLLDWTDGCVALTNAEMDQLYRVVPDGTPIDIRP